MTNANFGPKQGGVYRLDEQGNRVPIEGPALEAGDPNAITGGATPPAAAPQAASSQPKTKRKG